jgi:hypothetical protein
MVQIPDTIRPYVTILQKFHFWMLAALAPLVLLPLLFVAQAGIAQKIQTQRGKIKSSMDAVTAIFDNKPHPNEKWSEQIGSRAKEINDETLQVWEQLWKAQEPLRQWPESLGNDFVKAAASLPPGGSLRRSLLERYQNGIRPVVRLLPERMGADELMAEAASDEGPRAPRRQPVDRGEMEEPPSLLQWSGEDQQQLFTSFDWEEPPSTTQVVMAQEELWMYGVLCDVIRKVNSRPVAADPSAVITPANLAIPLVEELKVGYPAAEDDPGGKMSQRILRIQRSGGGLGEETPFSGDMMEMGAGGEAAGRPPHPRFGGGGGRGGPMGMMPGGSDEFGESAADGSPDDALKNWVYVDLDGKPLTASDLASASTSNILRLMPFVLRATIDQRALDALLVELASAPVPIDTRQVRINADQASGGDFGGRGSGRRRGIRPPRSSNRMGGDGIGGDRARLHDVNVELRGTLAIVMRPDPKLLTADADDGGGEGEDSE